MIKNIRELAFFYLTSFCIFISADAALAQATPSPAAAAGAAGGSGTLGKAIENAGTSLELVPGLFTAFSYLFGLFFGIAAIYKLKQHVDSPGNVSIWDSVKRFAAGGAFFALPTVLTAARSTFDPGLETQSFTGFLYSGAAGSGLDAMLVKLMKDIGQHLMSFMSVFAYLAGILLVMLGISRLLKSEQDGPRGPAGMGTIMTFLMGGALLASPELMGAFSSSMFDTSVVTSKGELQYVEGLADGGKRANAVIAAIIAFVAILGWISFLRGFFIMRGIAEGDNQASMMAGVTHLLGGALAVNLGPVLNAIQATLGIAAYGIKFS
jgi:hypothetical protein